MYVLERTSDKPALPAKLATFDLETIGTFDNQRLGAYAAGFYDGVDCQIFEGKRCVEDLMNFILVRKYTNYKIYAHNGGKFDFTFIMDYIRSLPEKDNYRIKPIRLGSSIVELKIYSKSGYNWTFRDSLHIARASLKNLTKNFGVEDIKGDFEHKKVTWRNFLKLAGEWKPYLISDCKGLYQVLDRYQDWIMENFNVSLVRTITTAQLAMNIYKKKFLPESITNHQSAEANIRKTYKGGRTEIFKKYGKNLRYYDVNSLYPSVMKKYKMPVGRPLKSFTMTIDDFGFMEATVECPSDLDIPLLGMKIDGKLIFPSGVFKDWFCSPELKKAKQLGYKIKIHQGYKFKSAHLFTGYINALYKIKQESTKGGVDYMMAKLLMNSLYGKFGQRRDMKKLTINPESTKGMEVVNFEHDIYSEEIHSDSSHILPGIASMVTAYARLKLYEVFEDVQKLGGDIYYCDTDSVITNIILPTGSKLGELSDELDGEVIKEGIFLLPKLYALYLSNDDKQVKSKGFPHGTFTFEEIKEALFTDNYSKLKYEQRKIATVFESLRRNNVFASMITKKRSVQTRYDKRISVGKYGTKPIILTLEDEEL